MTLVQISEWILRKQYTELSFIFSKRARKFSSDLKLQEFLKVTFGHDLSVQKLKSYTRDSKKKMEKDAELLGKRSGPSSSALSILMAHYDISQSPIKRILKTTRSSNRELGVSTTALSEIIWNRAPHIDIGIATKVEIKLLEKTPIIVAIRKKGKRSRWAHLLLKEILWEMYDDGTGIL